MRISDWSSDVSSSDLALCAVLGPLHLLEIGCGYGRYFDLYDESLGGLASYTGIDPRPRDSWRSDRPRRSFRQSTAEEISPETLKDTHLILQQSAIAPTGSVSGRERLGYYVYITVGDVALKKRVN